MTFDFKSRPRRSTATLAWGYNNYAGLGLGHAARVLAPARAGLPAGTVDVQGGTDFSVALTATGQVYTWGGNRWGQLGDGTTAHRFAPAPVDLPGNPHVTAIAAGGEHVLALTRDGRVFGWGRNHFGQVGDGTHADRRPSPVAVQTPADGRIERLAAGNGCSFAIMSSGRVYAWGHAKPFGAAVLPAHVGATHGGVATVVTPKRFCLFDNVVAEAVDAGQRHVVVLTHTGQLQAFGLTDAGRPAPGRLTINRSWGRVTAVSAGDNHTLALTEDGVVLAWGANRSGQLGTRTTKRQDTPVKVSIPKQQGRVVQVLAAGDTSFARTDAGHLYTWGHGGWGQHGSGTTADLLRPEPIELPDHVKAKALFAGRYHCFAAA